MPAPQATMMKELAKTQFRTFAIKVPNQPPQMNAPKTYPKAFKDSEKSAVPQPMPPALFMPDSNNKYHVDIQKQKTSDFTSFIDGICSAICSAWSTWQSAASLTGVVINGPTAMGGQVVGPPLTPLIMAQGPKSKPSELKFTTTVANVVGQAWLQYTATIKVTGMPWYPAFTMVPSPVAPPAPNVPCPVQALMQMPMPMMKMALKGQMMAQHGDPMAPHVSQLFDAIADGIDKCFQLWQKTTMVTQVMGTGPVPTFAPPYVPGGPVVGGVGNMIPGGFK